MKKILSLFLTAILVLCCVPSTASAFTTSMDRPMRLDNTPPTTAFIAGEPLGDKYMFPAFDNGEVVANKKQGRLPALGFNSWNAFGSANTETLAKAMADCFINLELDKVGYQYIVLDDGCYRSTRVDGKLANETTKFPGGFKALSDYMHDRGLKFGMYNDIGTRLCAGATVGTVGYEDVDAQTYLDWGVDFLKVDNCYYLWDNATNSAGSNVIYSWAPRIRSITVSGGDMASTTLYATDGTLLGTGASKSGSGASGYVTDIGVRDGTNTGQTPVGDLWSELSFNVNAPADGTYSLVVSYATATSGNIGRWLQVAVGPKESETRFFDGLLNATTNNTTFANSPEISVQLKEGSNIIRMMNHRRQENTLVSYAALLDGLNKAKPDHDVVLSICEWGKTQPQNWGKKVGNSWRILNDITFSVGNATGGTGTASWAGTGTNSIQGQYNKAVVMDEFAGRDKGWNDPDMMVIGMGGVSTLQSKTHMTMWCVMNSPIMLGFDLRRVTKGDDLWKIISNKDLIDLNQDPLGIQAKRIYYKIDSASAPGATPDTTYLNSANDNLRIDVLAKPLANGDIALSFINVGGSGARSASVDVDQIIKYIGGKMVNPLNFQNALEYKIKDIWTGAEYTQTSTTFSVTNLPAMDNLTIRIAPENYKSRDDLADLIKLAKTELAAKASGTFEYANNPANTALQNAISAAELVRDDVNADDEAITSAYKSLALQIVSFKGIYELIAGLKDSITSASTYVSQTAVVYTKKSLDRLIGALDAASSVLKNTNATESEMKAVMNAIPVAVDGLEILPKTVFKVAFSGASIKAEYTVSNGSDKNMGAVCILARYNTANRLIDVKTKTLDLGALDYENAELSVTFDKDSTYKAFIWDRDTFAPLMPAYDSGALVDTEVWRVAKTIEAGKSYVVVSAKNNVALTNVSVSVTAGNGVSDPQTGLRSTAVTIEGDYIVTPAIIPDNLVWNFTVGTSENAGPFTGQTGFFLRNTSPGSGAGTNPVLRNSSSGSATCPLRTNTAVPSGSNHWGVFFFQTPNAETGQTSACLHSANTDGTVWIFALYGTSSGFVGEGGNIASNASLTATYQANAPIKLYEKVIEKRPVKLGP